MTATGANGQYVVGMDVGSTTTKATVRDRRSKQVLWRDYQRHEGRQAQKAYEFFLRMESELKLSPSNTQVFVTGSGGSPVGELVGGKFVQEVTAVSLAVEKLFPEVYTVIELGGQDSKMIFFRDEPNRNVRQKFCYMNDKCAGGTGAVLDKISAKLHIAPDVLCQQGYRGIRTHRVAAKCGVFAETDINSLQKQGVSPEELIASLFEAIVLQNLTVLTHGHSLNPRVLLLGGPNTFIRGMREAWQAHIPRMWQERGIAPPEGIPPEELIRTSPEGQYFAAQGAVEFGCEQEPQTGRYAGLQRLEEFLRGAGETKQMRSSGRGLWSSQEEIQSFIRQYTPEPFQARPLPEHSVARAFLGVDGGSTSTKAVLLGEDGEVIGKAYRLSQNNPIQETVEVIQELRQGVESQRARVKILGVGTTGYAKDVLQKILRADVGLVETVAHARAATHYYGYPDVIVDVGGQDIKLIILKEGHVKDFMLNTQCSAGNGYFLQATGASFGIDVDRYAETAFQAERMPEFGYGCAVFLQSDIVNFQRQGWQPEEILAGLAAVLPKNIWHYIAKIPNLPLLGRRFLLQGGTQKNLAAVKAQIDYIRKGFRESSIEPEILVHKHCGEAGAIGAALEAQRLYQDGKRTEFIGLDAVRKIAYRTTTNEATVCQFCNNHCLRTFIDYRTDGLPPSQPEPDGCNTRPEDGEQRLIIASCEKGAAGTANDMRAIVAEMGETKKRNPNLVEIAARTVWKSPAPMCVADSMAHWAWPVGRRRIQRQTNRGDIRIGIPRVLNFYSYAPFFAGYLMSLGVKAENIIYSDFTTDTLYREGARFGAIDPCFPSKVTIAHIHNLIQKHHPKRNLRCIFFPMFQTLDSPLVNTISCHACPTVTATPQVIKAALSKEGDLFAQNGILFLNPIVSLDDQRLLQHQMLDTWGEILGLSPRENERAVDQGFQARERWIGRIRREARAVLDMLEREQRLGIVILGRPYHHDPGLNHGIIEEFQRRGYPVLSQSTLPLDEDLLDRLFGEEVRSGTISHSLDIMDVWKHPYSASTSHKIWAAKFVARHPNLIAVEFSSFKCGHDAPIYQLIENIIECAGRPHFSFKDLDENKPAGSIKIRIETIDYFLKQNREGLIRRKISVPSMAEDDDWFLDSLGLATDCQSPRIHV
jgi:predicted CoA-substrate-specific enzyme activase